MRSFAELSIFGAFLVAAGKQAEDQAARALREGAHLVAQDAKARLGRYDGNDWPQLAERTQESRSALGYAPNNPLVVTGALHDAIIADGRGREAVAGVRSDAINGDGVSLGDVAVWQELGTANAKHPIPPRPFLAPAGADQVEAIAALVGKTFTGALAGERPPKFSGD